MSSSRYFSLSNPFSSSSIPTTMFFQRLFAMASYSFSSSSSSPKTSIQSLYDTCKKNLTLSTSPPPQVIHQLSSKLDTIGPADVGLTEEHQEDDRGHGFSTPNTLNRVDRWAQPITYVELNESESFTMCMFCFPTFSVIPLHDHPGMTVLSKVLYGSLHVKGYDWVEPACIKDSNQISRAPGLPKMPNEEVLSKLFQDDVYYSGNLKEALLDSGILGKTYVESRSDTMKNDWQAVYDMMNCSGFQYDKERSCETADAGVWDKYIANVDRIPLIVRLAKLAVDKVFSAPCSSSVLYPKAGGNLHCFTAVTPCAVLDILTPPYEESAGRKCTYYRDYPYSSFRSGDEPIDGKEDEYAWLEEIDTPDDLYMREGMYAGPPIQI